MHWTLDAQHLAVLPLGKRCKVTRNLHLIGTPKLDKREVNTFRTGLVLMERKGKAAG